MDIDLNYNLFNQTLFIAGDYFKIKVLRGVLCRLWAFKVGAMAPGPVLNIGKKGPTKQQDIQNAIFKMTYLVKSKLLASDPGVSKISTVLRYTFRIS